MTFYARLIQIFDSVSEARLLFGNQFLEVMVESGNDLRKSIVPILQGFKYYCIDPENMGDNNENIINARLTLKPFSPYSACKSQQNPNLLTVYSN